MAKQSFIASLDEFPNVLSFNEETLESFGVEMKVLMSMNIVVEELFTNVAKFAYPNKEGKCDISIELVDNSLTYQIIDSGFAFDPLAKEDPDITLHAEDRDIGGLGILMCKKLTDEIKYERINNQNVVTFVKKI